MNELYPVIYDLISPIISKYEAPKQSLIRYVFDVLGFIYDKKFCKKHIYKEYIDQIICELFPKMYGRKYNNFHIFNNSHIVEYLKTIPQFEQRTPEWFKMKEDSIGASESAIIFGKSIFSNEKKLLLKKSGQKQEFNSNPACTHGTKYEPIVQLLYQMKNNVKLYEFGSIVHPIHKMISASPDGITKNGVMVEIKVPYKRKITGIPPIYYWYQMQQQMEVCNLDRVDFVECKIVEYLNKKNFLDDTNDKFIGESYYTTCGNIKNIIIEYYKKNSKGEMDIDWVYPPKFLKINKIKLWVKKVKEEIRKQPEQIFSREIFFKIEKYSSCPVWRDCEWWNNNYKKFITFWEKVEHYRKIGYETLIVKKKPRKKRVVKCLIDENY